MSLAALLAALQQLPLPPHLPAAVGGADDADAAPTAARALLLEHPSTRCWPCQPMTSCYPRRRARHPAQPLLATAAAVTTAAAVAAARTCVPWWSAWWGTSRRHAPAPTATAALPLLPAAAGVACNRRAGRKQSASRRVHSRHRRGLPERVSKVPDGWGLGEGQPSAAAAAYASIEHVPSMRQNRFINL